MKPLCEAPRFLICRLSAIGDVVHTLPLAHVIKDRWPQAFVAWAVEKGAAPLVQGVATVDETVVVPKGFLKSPTVAWNLAARLRALRIDVALDVQSLTKSATLGCMASASRRIGFTKPIGRELAPWLNNQLVAPRERHVVRRYLEILRPLGVHASQRDVRFELPRNVTAELNANKMLAAAAIAGSIAVINPGAGWDSKIWPCERLAAVARELSVPSLVVWSGEKEKAWAEQIVAGSGGKSKLAPPTTLLDLVALCRRARLFIGSDTGPLHIAAAVQTPCVAIFGPTRPEVCGPYGQHHIVLHHGDEDLGHARKASGKISNAMLQVTSMEVLAACETILRRNNRAGCAA